MRWPVRSGSGSAATCREVAAISRRKASAAEVDTEGPVTLASYDGSSPARPMQSGFFGTLPQAMTDVDREALEGRIRHLCEAGNFGEATNAALRGYGSEIFALLIALHRSEPDAAEVFAELSERVWKGL